MRFDQASIETAVGGGSLVSATLELTIDSIGNNWGPDGRMVDVHRLTTAWTEAGPTWNCADDSQPSNSSPDCDPEWDGGAFDEDATDSALHANGMSGTVAFDVTADVAAFLAGTPNHGWLLKKFDEGASGEVEYSSREGGAAAAPRLVVVVESPTFDEVPPAVTFTAPEPAIVVGDPTPEIVVEYADGGSGVDLASVEIQIDGADVTASCTVGASAAVCEPGPLTDGDHLATATVRDLAGNEAIASLEFELLLGPGPLMATLTAIADSYLRQGQPNQNQGGESLLRVRQSGNNRALVRFDASELAAIVGTGSVLAAHLELHVADNGDNWSSEGREVGAHRVIGAWTELEATWNCGADTDVTNQQPDCSPQWDGGSFEPVASDLLLHTNGLEGRVSFDVTADVQAFLAGVATDRGWLIKKAQEGSSGRVDYSSRETGAATAPRLTVVFVPAGESEDVTLPVLVVVAPADGTELDDSAPEIVIEYSDSESGVVTDSLEISIERAEPIPSESPIFDLRSRCSVGPAAAACQAPALQGDGSLYTLRASVEDAAGNGATVASEFSVRPRITGDPTPPEISILEPSTPEIVDDPTPEIIVTYSDIGSGVSLLDFELLLDWDEEEAEGVVLTGRCEIGPSSATCEPPPLQLGEHTLTARILDLTFGVAEDTRVFSIQATEVERERPTLTIVAPDQPMIVDDATPQIVVSYSDAGSGIDFSTLSILAGTKSALPYCDIGPAQAVCEPLPLDEGPQRVSASVRDLHGNGVLTFFDFEIVRSQPDPVPPEIRFIAPGEGEVVTSVITTVAFELADGGSGVDLSSLSVAIDGRRLFGSDCWPALTVTCPDLPFDHGEHEVGVSVRDYEGNLAEASLAFEVDLLPEDATPPEIRIHQPAGDTVRRYLLSEVEVRYHDDGTGVPRGQSRVLLDGIELTCSTGSPLRCPVTALELGPHLLEAEATDRRGNRGTASLTFTVIDDDIPPSVFVVSPEQDRIVGDATPEIVIGYVDRGSGMDLGSFRAFVDEAEVTSACMVEAERATCELPALAPGWHTLVAEIRDQRGNLGNTEFVFEVTLDIPVEILSPTAGLLTREESIDISGTVPETVDSVEVAGVAATLGAGSFVAEDVPLREGGNTLTVVARTAEGGIGTATITLVRDRTAPRVVVRTPPDGLVTSSTQLIVAGEYHEASSSATATAPAAVEVGGLPAAVEQRSFVVEDYLLRPGENRIRVTATDEAGNQGVGEVTVISRPDAPVRLEELGGNGQEGTAGGLLPEPLTVRMSDAFGSPLAGRQVRFGVTRGAGRVGAVGEEAAALTVRTDAQGIARVPFTLGGRSGAGSHEVVASSPGLAERVVFCGSATTSEPLRIVRVVGNDQTGALAGAAGQPYAKPFYVQVFDALGNPVPDVSVLWEVIQGAGSFGGSPSIETPTDDRGIAFARFTLGPDPGHETNLVRASFEGLSETPVTLAISGLEPRPGAPTAVRGLVLDNEDEPVEGVTIGITGTSLAAVSGSDGRFRIACAPVGTVELDVDGTSTTRPGVWPHLHFQLTTIAGQENELGMPIRLLPLDDAGARIVGGPTDVTIPMAGVAGAELTVFANSATFADGSPTGEVLVTQVHGDKVPMQAPMGSNFMLAWTIQPAGVRFDPPARLSIPNSGEAAGTVVDIFSFDHDIGEFVPVGTATVTPDGRQIVTNPGSGVIKAGWHGCVPPPAPPGNVCQPGGLHALRSRGGRGCGAGRWPRGPGRTPRVPLSPDLREVCRG